jgi:ABC-type antimicrobial peptide transport system permease subunit
MDLLGLIATNLARHKARTLATALGIALGVGMIIALLSVGSGLKRTASQLIHLGQADLGIFQSGVADPTASVLPLSMVDRLDRQPYVREATPLLLIVEGIRQSPAAIVFGAQPDGFLAQRLVITGGNRGFGPDRVMVGDSLAESLDLHPGSTLAVKGKPFAVAGVYHTGILFEDTGAILDLRVAQELQSKASGTAAIGAGATTIAVQLNPDIPHDTAENDIRRAFPGTTVIGSNDDPSRIGANGELVGKAVTIIAALALIVGGLGVANTMAMAVLERERELALLSAVGWRRRRIAFLVLAEGVATSVLGAGVGLLLGIIGADGLNQALGVSSVVSPHVTPWTIGQALLIGVAIGVLGGLYPAWRGTSVSPQRLLSGA